MTIHQVREFNTTFGVPMSETPTSRVPAAGLRYELIREEFEELAEAIENLDIVEIADALGDIQYVAHGAVLVFGLDSDDHGITNLTHRGYSIISKIGRDYLLDELRQAILWDDVDELVNVLDAILISVKDLARQFGLDIDEVVDAIHRSNMSKLGEDGKPIYRETDNKVLKGPNYKTPTDDIRKLVFGDNYAPTGE